MKISIYVAIGLELRTSSPSEYSRTNISRNFEEGVIFAIRCPNISKINEHIKKQRQPSRCKILRSTSLDLTQFFFSMSLMVFEIFWKKKIQKSLSGSTVYKNDLTLIKYVENASPD